MVSLPSTWVNFGKAKLMGLGLAGAFILVLLVAWALRSCQPTPPPKIPPKVQKSIDSLATTRPSFDSAAVAGRQEVARDTTRATGFKKQGTQAEATANFAKITADSLAASAARTHASDSAAAAWKDAYDARTREAEAWHVAAVRNDSAYQAERDARVRLAGLYAADTLRRIATEKVNGELQDAIKKLQVPCTVPGTFGKVPCPSRTVVMVGSAGLGLLAGKFLAGK